MGGERAATAPGGDGQTTMDAELCRGDDRAEDRRLQPDPAGLRPQELREHREHEEIGLGVEQAGQHALPEGRGEAKDRVAGIAPSEAPLRSRQNPIQAI